MEYSSFQRFFSFYLESPKKLMQIQKRQKKNCLTNPFGKLPLTALHLQKLALTFPPSKAAVAASLDLDHHLHHRAGCYLRKYFHISFINPRSLVQLEQSLFQSTFSLGKMINKVTWNSCYHLRKFICWQLTLLIISQFWENFILFYLTKEIQQGFF